MLNHPNTRDPRVIQVYRDDPDVPRVCAASVTVQNIAQSAGEILVTFARPDAVWVDAMGVVLSDQKGETQVSADRAIVLYNDGDVQARPPRRLSIYTLRTSVSATEGWQYKRKETITSAGVEDWRDLPMILDLADTAAWVTTPKALSSGNDVRVVLEGEDLPRSFV